MVLLNTEEVEVFRLTTFEKDKCYEFALCTRTEGKYPNEKYYTTNSLQYLGKYIKSERCGYGDGSGGAEYFDNNGVQIQIMYDYEGRTCFRAVPRVT
jgi:hypothetical protein